MVPRALSGTPTPTEPHEKPHTWVSEYGSSDARSCSVCGAQEMGLIRADMEDRSGMQTGKKSRLYHYCDAHGKQISSLIPLGCPLWVGDVAGTLAETKQRLRNTTGRVQGVEGRVASVEDRLAAVEAENEALRAQIQHNHAGVVAFASWLTEMVAEHVRRGEPTVSLEVGGTPYQLPPPVANLIRDLGAIPVEVEVPREDG